MSHESREAEPSIRCIMLANSKAQKLGNRQTTGLDWTATTISFPVFKLIESLKDSEFSNFFHYVHCFTMLPLPNNMNLSFDKASIAEVRPPHGHNADKELVTSASRPKMVTSTDGKSLVLFWDTVFSNFFPAQIVVNGKKFTCSEQYFMYQKALFFGDNEIAEKILAAPTPGEQKALGRKVKNFDEAKWKGVALRVMKRACYEKFTQNPQLRRELYKTVGSTLVEASPTDRIWGVGLGAEDRRILDVKQWRGFNQLGYILTALREHLMALDRTKV